MLALALPTACPAMVTVTPLGCHPVVRAQEVFLGQSNPYPKAPLTKKIEAGILHWIIYDACLELCVLHVSDCSLVQSVAVGNDLLAESQFHRRLNKWKSIRTASS